jgi:hypothetical protein
VQAVDQLAELPAGIKRRLGQGLTGGLYIGPGWAVDLDNLGHLRHHPVPGTSYRYGLVPAVYDHDLGVLAVGDQPSKSPSVLLHETGHFLDLSGGARSTERAFRRLYDRCRPFISDPSYLPPAELFAEAAAVTLGGRPLRLRAILGGRDDLAYALYEYMCTTYDLR